MILTRARAREQTSLGLVPVVAGALLALAATLYLLTAGRKMPLATAIPLSVAVPLPLLGAIAFERLRARRLTLRDTTLSVLLFLVVGYAVFNRTFGYLGIPQLNLFVGEVVLAAGLLLLPASLPATLGRLVARHPAMVAALVVWSAYGLVQVLRGVAAGYGVVEALRQSAFHYYLLYLPLGALAGGARDAPARVYGALRVLAWLTAVYGVLNIGFLYRYSDLLIPGTYNTVLFPQISAAGSSPTVIAVLALVCLRSQLGFRPVVHWLLLAANLGILLGVQVRQDYVALAVSLLVWAALSQRDRFRPAWRVGLTVVLLGSAAWLSDLEVPSVRGPIGVRQVIARVLTAVNPAAANQITGEAEETADVASDNVEWRTRWWAAIREHVGASPGLLLLGEGYGYRLNQLVDYVSRDVWTSHSVLYDTLGRLGAIGVGLFALGFITVLAAVVRAALGGPAHGAFRLLVVAYAVGFYVGAHFFNSFGSPFGAVPLWILLGLALSPLGASQGAQAPEPPAVGGERKGLASSP